jgi:hypothetical protein
VEEVAERKEQDEERDAADLVLEDQLPDEVKIEVAP